MNIKPMLAKLTTDFSPFDIHYRQKGTQPVAAAGCSGTKSPLTCRKEQFLIAPVPMLKIGQKNKAAEAALSGVVISLFWFIF